MPKAVTNQSLYSRSRILQAAGWLPTSGRRRVRISQGAAVLRWESHVATQGYGYCRKFIAAGVPLVGLVSCPGFSPIFRSHIQAREMPMLTKPVAALVFTLALSIPGLAEDQVVNVPSDDVEMNAAIEQARSTLPDFWARFADPAPDEADFSLKLGITDSVGTEHFWCGEIEGDAKTATCVIANEPVHVHTVSYGERVAVDPDIISDWLYYRDGKIVGGETIRVMLPRLDKKEAAILRAQLAEP